MAQQTLQLLHALAVLGRQHAHGQAQALTQTLNLDGNAHLAGFIGHGHHDHHWQALGFQIGQQAALALQLGGTHHQHDQVRSLVLQKSRDHFFVFGVSAQIVNARQVDQLHQIAAHNQTRTQQVDRDARPVAHLGVGACQPIEQGGFAGVGHAHQGDFFHAVIQWVRGVTWMSWASERRNMTSVSPKHTCRGPPQWA